MIKQYYRTSVSMVALLVAVGLGCERGQRTDTAAASTVEARENVPSIKAAPGSKDEGSAPRDETFYHSPFVVHLDAENFDTVSFKDVGLGRTSPMPQDPLLETISQAFIYEVSGHADLNYEGEVVYDERILDPANHLYCGERHLYIDVWRAESPRRWGYSMWSGCGEMDNFEWKEVEVEPGEEATLVEEVSPLVESIVDSLAKAKKAGCFRKNC